MPVDPMVGPDMSVFRRLLVGAAILLVTGAVALLVARSRPPSPEVPTTAEDVSSADPASVPDPVAAGEPLPDGYRPFLDRDQILPVYEPTFTTPDLVDWPDDSLVVGVSGAETAKAYPVTHLNQREMVIDVIDGSPILVSW